MPAKRIEIIPPVHGKLTSEGNVSEPDIFWILERWLERHAEVESRRKDIRIVRGEWTTEDGLETEVVYTSIEAGDDVADYDPRQDADLYEYWTAEDGYWEEG